MKLALIIINPWGKGKPQNQLGCLVVTLTLSNSEGEGSLDAVLSNAKNSSQSFS